MKAMKLRQVLHSGRATVAALAGTVMVIGGAGAGTAALALSHSAGALSLQAPAIAVKEQNVNAAGRIRVALPNGGVGVNGTVSVNNFPKSVNVGNLPENSAGELKVASSPTAPQLLNQQYDNVNGVTIQPGQNVTMLNINGSGIFQGVELGNNQTGGLCLTINIDGRTVFGDGIGVASNYMFPPSPVMSNAGSPNNSDGIYFFPPLGMPFHQSLNIIATNACGGTGGATTTAAWRIWYQTAAA